MDGNIYQNSPNTGYPPDAPDLSNGESNGIMPPLAPSFKHSPWRAESTDYHSYDSEQQALNRLMDSVHKSRIEDVRIGQDTAKICLEDAQIVGGAIEIRARIIPEPGVQLERGDHPSHLISAPYPNQFQPQYPYQYQRQIPLQYTDQYPYQYLNQLPAQTQYSYQYPYQYPNQLPFQYAYQYQYPSRFPTRYLYQYPMANAAGGIASAISQLVLTANLLRR